MIHKSKCHQAVMSALLPLGVCCRALGHISLHMQARDALAVELADRRRERCAGLGCTLNANREIKGDQQSTTHK